MKAMAIAPQSKPTTHAKYKYLISRFVVTSKGRRLCATWNLELRISRVIVEEITAEAADIKSIGEKRLCASSRIKNKPVSGAAVAAAKPAAAPPVIMYLSQAVFFREKSLTVPLPIAVPICTLGPSLPKGMPERNVTNADENTAKILRNHLKSMSPRIRAIAVGIPPPFAMPRNFTAHTETRPKISAPPKRRGRYLGSERTDEYIVPDKSKTLSAASWKRNITTPVKIPVMPESRMLGVRMFLT